MPLRLRVISQQQQQMGAARVREFAACGGTIGRAADNDWVLPDEKRYLSSRHAMIDFQAGAYYLIDTSRNGVFVNDSDTAVGRGHPQRLFDGDILRLGEYSLAVEITPEPDDGTEDGMRDSIVRAQLVAPDESMEFKLVNESQMRAFDYDALERHLAHVELDATGSVAPASPGSPGPRPADGGHAAALAMFCQAAGLTPADLRGANPEENLRAAGALTRELLSGLAALLRRHAQGRRDPVRSLLDDPRIPPAAAVRSAIEEIRNQISRS